MSLRLSVKARVTAWFTALMLIVTAGALAVVIMLGGALFEASAKERLARAVNHNSEYVEYENDGRREKFEMDEEFEPYSFGTYCLVYTREGEILSGTLPEGFPDGVPLADKEPFVVETQDRHFYVYDRTADKGRLWVRGIKLADGGEALLDEMTDFAFFMLPFLVLISAAGGYLIVRRAFRPIDRIISAVEAMLPAFFERHGLTKRIEQFGSHYLLLPITRSAQTGSTLVQTTRILLALAYCFLAPLRLISYAIHLPLAFLSFAYIGFCYQANLVTVLFLGETVYLVQCMESALNTLLTFPFLH